MDRDETGGTSGRAWYHRPGQLEGTLILVGAAQFLLGMLLAEALYPGYSISGNSISDLGATCANAASYQPGPCFIQQPSADIFNGSVFILGVLILVSAYLVRKRWAWRSFSVPLSITGLGAMGVGIFTEATLLPHFATSYVAFLFGGISAVWSGRILKPPMSYAALLLGVLALLDLMLFTGRILLGLGIGGMERMIVYPVVLWAVGFGAYLTAAPPVDTERRIGRLNNTALTRSFLKR